jgi:phosphoribosylanthranilate isomerase
MSKIRVKICGLREARHIKAAAEAGAAYVGFMFYAKSPRNVSFAQAAALALEVPVGVAKVAVTVNADDSVLDALVAAVPLDMLQLHGSESPSRVTEIRTRYGLPVMKAVGVSSEADLVTLDAYASVTDQLLVESKPPKDGLPGGNGLVFDWNVLTKYRWAKPWMLAGGLTIHNVAEAIRISGARQIDLSSGVEISPGIKDERLIAEFIAAVQGT